MEDFIVNNLLNLLKFKQNEILMMLDRGCLLTDEQNFILKAKSLEDLLFDADDLENNEYALNNINSDNLRQKWKNTNVYYHKNTKQYTLIGYSMTEDQKTNKEDLVNFQQQLLDFSLTHNMKRSIYISTVGLGSGAKELSSILTSTYFTQFFNENDLYYNPTKHMMYQEHYALNEDEKVKILNELHISINQIPQIITADQVVKWFGWFEGTVIRITRNDPPNNQYYDYRLVVNRDWTD